MDATERVREANQSFYDAFEARDMEAMGAVWEHSDRATVTHPGWPMLRTWPAVAESWQQIFDHTPYIQFFLTDAEVVVGGDVAWVTLYEDILQEIPAADRTKTNLGDTRVAATNVFIRNGERWLLVIHHGSPVAGR